ncbi:MAG: PRC-barrel domain-containing protein [Gemmobacter sp.]
MLAQTAQTGTTAQTGMTGQHTEMTGFLATRGQSDVFASDLIGHVVYARRAMDATAGTAGQTTAGQTTAGQTAGTQTTEGQTASGMTAGGQGTEAYAAKNSDGTKNMRLMNRADLDQMEDIGRINDLVVSSDGTIRAVIIDVGGFLGMGAREVAVTMDQVTFASDTEDRNEIYVVVNTGSEMLKDSPAYDRTSMTGDQVTGRTQDTAQQGTAQQGTGRTAFTAPGMQRDGFDRVTVADVSAEMLTGQTVYGVNDNSVGTIDDLILDDKGAITNVIINFGGFLGIGTSQVSVGFDELTILADSGRSNVRVYVDATKEQVQAQPQYRATN